MLTPFSFGCILWTKGQTPMRIQVNFDSLLGKKIAAEGHKITLKQVSEATGISQNRLIEYRKGKATAIKFDTLVSLCAYFGCTPGDLLTLAD